MRFYYSKLNTQQCDLFNFQNVNLMKNLLAKFIKIDLFIYSIDFKYY